MLKIFVVQCHPRNIFNIKLFPKYSVYIYIILYIYIIYIDIYIYIYIHIYTYIHTYVYVYIRMYTHTLKGIMIMKQLYIVEGDTVV